MGTVCQGMFNMMSSTHLTYLTINTVTHITEEFPVAMVMNVSYYIIFCLFSHLHQYHLMFLIISTILF